MVIETPEGLTLLEPAENSSFYIVQEHEGQETPPGTIIWLKPFLEFCGSTFYDFILVSIATEQEALLGYSHSLLPFGTTWLSCSMEVLFPLLICYQQT